MIQRKDDPNAQPGNTATEVVDELENLAAGVEQGNTDEAGQQGQGASQVQQPAGLPPALIAGLALIPVWLLRILRERIARTMPEIHNHWTDAALQGPGEAAAPIIVRYLDRLAPFAAAYPEVTLLVVACLPLGLGYVAAMTEHEAKQASVVPENVAQVIDSGAAPQGDGQVSASGALSHAAA